LYNLAQDARNTGALEEAELPSYLVRPFPAAWMCDPDSDDGGEGGGPGGGAGSMMSPPRLLTSLHAEYGMPTGEGWEDQHKS